MRVLTVIPARGGSARIVRKNVRLLGGKPLIAWTIECAAAVSDPGDILVSTDDAEIAAVSQQAGAAVPWLRPPELATATASSIDVCLHALDWFENTRGPVDGLILLAPTSPFRTPATVERGRELFDLHRSRTVIGVSPAASHPLWCFEVSGDRMRPFVASGGLQVRSQDLPPAYIVNGAFYMIAPDTLRTGRSFFPPDMVPLVVDAPAEGIDLDTEWDWQLAEAIVAGGLHHGRSGRMER